MQTPSERYRAGEVIEWWSLENGTRTRRMVEVLETRGARLIVGYGYNSEGVIRRYDVGLSEVRRTPPPEVNPHLPNGVIPVRAPLTFLTAERIAERLVTRQNTLAGTQEKLKAARAATVATQELVSRAAREHETARAALLTLDAHHRSEARKLENALRANETPPPTKANGQDRGLIMQRVQATQSAVEKFAGEDEQARSRLSEAVAAVRAAALAVLALYLERDCQRLRELEEVCLQFRADCLKASQVWMSAADGPIKLSEASATLLTNPPDYDRVQFLAKASVTDTWKQLFERLLTDPTADFTVTEEAEPVSQAAE
jgi:hypothetical protein